MRHPPVFSMESDPFEFLLNYRDAGFFPTAKALFDNAGITPVESGKALSGLRGEKIIDGLTVTVHLLPLYRSRYRGQRRTGASKVGYRLTIEVDCDVAVRFSVVHGGIAGSRFIAWINKIKRINRVSDDLLNRYGHQVWCSDSRWAENLLKRTGAKVAITDLLRYKKSEAGIGHPCVFISPTNIQYFRRAVTLGEFRGLTEYINDVGALYTAAINISPPTKPRQASYFERLFKKKPFVAGGLTIAAIFLFLLAGVFLALAFVGGLLWLFDLIN